MINPADSLDVDLNEAMFGGGGGGQGYQPGTFDFGNFDPQSFGPGGGMNFGMPNDMWNQAFAPSDQLDVNLNQAMFGSDQPDYFGGQTDFGFGSPGDFGDMGGFGFGGDFGFGNVGGGQGDAFTGMDWGSPGGLDFGNFDFGW
jgi:hypothetical protein